MKIYGSETLMKCGFCGNELENGAQFCPNCGMIISLGEENEAAQEDDAVVESVYNVFKSNIEKEKKEPAKQTAKELEADPTEEKVEFVMSLPEFEDYATEPIKAPEHIELPDHSAKYEKVKAEEVPEATAEDMPEEAAEETAGKIVEEASEDTAEEVPETPTEDTVEDIYSYSSEDMKAQDEAEEAETEPLDIRVPEMSVIYEGPEKAPEPIEVPKTAPKNEELRSKKQAKENLEKISPNKKEAKQKTKKAKKKGVDGIKIEGVLGVAVAVILVLFACVYAVKNDKIPVLGQLFGNDTTTEQTQPSGDSEWTESRPEEFIGENGKKIYVDDEGNYYYYDNDGVTYPYVVPSTDESTSEEDTTESTTEEDTTESTTKETTTETTTESTTKPTTTKPTTTKPTTTKPTTTKPTTTKPTATKPTTTKPVTTRPVTTPSTSRPTTTKPAATKPTTTKPSSTTDPYGINDVTVKKPTAYLSKSYTAYVTAEGVNLRSKPSVSSDRVLYLSKGADVLVLAKENGFFYIKSNRYGVYGWVSASYVADTRPQSEGVVQSGTVSPDKKYAAAETKYTTNSLNIRKGPSTSYDVVALIPISYPVKVIGYKSGVSGWVYVQDTTYGYTGWVSTAYLK